MGYNADKFTARGSLYLETEASSSYCGEYVYISLTKRKKKSFSVPRFTIDYDPGVAQRMVWR